MTNPEAGRPGLDLSADDMSLLDQLLAEAGVEASAGATIEARAAGSPTPMSFSQELLWMLDRASPGMTAYKLPIARRLIGELDVPALARSLNAIVARHESLRTRFVAIDGEPMQVIDPPAPLELAMFDVRGAHDPEQEAERLVRDTATRPFDLAREHAFRPTLVRVAERAHVLVLDSHHIVFDGWSRDVLFRELAACYTAYRDGAEPVLPALPIQFADFARWQREHLAGERLAELLEFWRNQLGDVVESLDLPTDRPRTAAPGFLGARARQLIAPELLGEIKELARRNDATLYMVLLAAYMTVLHRYSGSDRVLVGSGSAGRTHAETEGLIGYFNNTLVQRGDFAGDPTFGQLLAQVRTSALGAYDHQDIPLEKLILELREGQQHLHDAPLFRAVLTMQDGLEANIAFAGIELKPFAIDMAATKFDLTLLPAERAEGLWLALQYRSDLYEPATAERFLGHVESVLQAAVTDSSQRVSILPLLSRGELNDIAAWNRTTVEFDAPLTVHGAIEAASARTPGALAIVCGDEQLTYAQLDCRANQLAHRLRELGVTRGTAVAILLDRSADAVVALFGVLKAGGYYVPLATDVPAARLAQQVAEGSTAFAVSRSPFASLLPATMTVACFDTDAAELARQPATAPVVEVASTDIAYVLFTSGSTGIPKGVAVTHRNLANYTRAIGRVLGTSSIKPLSFATVSTLTADLGNTALFPALVNGGTLHVLPSGIALDGPQFAAYGAEHAIDVLKITPSHLRAVLNAAGGRAAAILPRRWLVLGGEACAWDLVEEVQRLGQCEVLNHYGPTETTVGASVFAASRRDEVPLGATVPIGFPLANVQLHVLDAALQPLPIGIPGELCIGGAGVAQGYVNRPDLTAERFVELSGVGRLYRTGDQVRRLPGGAIEFLGRGDGQVKIRGFRVELGEIEQVLAQFPGIDHAAVMLHPDEAEPSILAYVVPRTGGYAAAHAVRPTPERLREWVAERLPDFMVPHAIMILDHLPLNANGKLDRRSLPIPGAIAVAASGIIAPRTPTEEALVTIWGEALKREQVGVRDNFFELGGHSLVAIRVLGKVSRILGVRMALRSLFEAPTIEQLAARIDSERSTGASSTTDGAIKPIARTPRTPDTGRPG